MNLIPDLTQAITAFSCGLQTEELFRIRKILSTFDILSAVLFDQFFPESRFMQMGCTNDTGRACFYYKDKGRLRFVSSSGYCYADLSTDAIDLVACNKSDISLFDLSRTRFCIVYYPDGEFIESISGFVTTKIIELSKGHFAIFHRETLLFDVLIPVTSEVIENIHSNYHESISGLSRIRNVYIFSNSQSKNCNEDGYPKFPFSSFDLQNSGMSPQIWNQYFGHILRLGFLRYENSVLNNLLVCRDNSAIVEACNLFDSNNRPIFSTAIRTCSPSLTGLSKLVPYLANSTLCLRRSGPVVFDRRTVMALLDAISFYGVKTDPWWVKYINALHPNSSPMTTCDFDIQLFFAFKLLMFPDSIRLSSAI
jgi:hypothetical protein